MIFYSTVNKFALKYDYEQYNMIKPGDKLINIHYKC